MPFFRLAYPVKLIHCLFQVLNCCVLDKLSHLEYHQMVKNVCFHDNVLLQFDNESIQKQFAAWAMCKRCELADSLECLCTILAGLAHWFVDVKVNQDSFLSNLHHKVLDLQCLFDVVLAMERSGFFLTKEQWTMADLPDVVCRKNWVWADINVTWKYLFHVAVKKVVMH